MIAAIETSKGQPFGRVLFALGIPHVGSVTAQALADGFGSMDALRNATPEEIAEVEGVGPVIAEQVAGWFLDPEHAEIVDELAAAGPAHGGPAPRPGARRARWPGRRSSSPGRWTASRARASPSIWPGSGRR